MSNVKSRDTVATLAVRGRTFDVERITWKNSDGLSFDVTDVATGALLHNDSFDEQPGESEIAELLDQLAEEYSEGALDSFHDEADIATIVGRVAKTRVVVFCDSGTYAPVEVARIVEVDDVEGFEELTDEERNTLALLHGQPIKGRVLLNAPITDRGNA